MTTIMAQRRSAGTQRSAIRSRRARRRGVPGTASLLVLLVLGGCTTEPNPFDQPQSTAFALNDLGQIVGSSDADGGIRAVMWERGTIRDLGVLPGTEWSSASAVNNRGDVVGVSGKRSCVERQPDDDHYASVFLWDGSTMSDLTNAGPACMQVEAINDSGYVVLSGLAAQPGFSVWQEGTRHDFGLLNFVDLNNRGQVLLHDPFDPDAAPMVWRDGVK